MQHTITLVQDRRFSSACSSNGGSFAPVLSNKRGIDGDSEDKIANAAKRHVGAATPDTPQHGSAAQEEEKQQEVQDMQDLVDRWLKASPPLLDEATCDRLLAALYRCDAVLLRAWRCNKQQSDETIKRRLLLALPAE